MTPAPRPATRPVARLSTPGEIAAVVPVLCGFVPHESLVVVSLRGPRRRLGLTMRFDLDWLLADLEHGAAEIALRLEHDGADRAVLVLHTEAPDDDGLAGAAVADAVQAACTVEVDEALLVRDGRWWSYVCADPRCCPPEGTPMAGAPSSAVRLVEAERVLEGRAVLASREELVRSLAAPRGAVADEAERHAERALDDWLEHHHRDGALAVRAEGLALAARLVDAGLCGTMVGGPDAARLAVALQDVLVRDEVATWCLDRGDALLGVLLQSARQLCPPEDAPVLVLVAWVAYARGDGGLANVALERCLASDPGCTLAHLLAEMLGRQVPPAEVRTLLAATRDQLRAQPS